VPIHVALHHLTEYTYDRLVSLSPQLVRLRPAPHCRTPILSYSLLVEPTPAALARGLDVLLHSPALREQLALSARRLATTRYSLTQFRASIANAYRRIAVAPLESA